MIFLDRSYDPIYSLLMQTATALYEAYTALVTKHSLDGTSQFGEFKAREDDARAKVLAVDPEFFTRREAEARADAIARYGVNRK